MEFALTVGLGPAQGTAAAAACSFATAALAAGHRVRLIFFHGDGVYTGLAHATVAPEDLQVTERLSQLAQRHGVALVVCAGAASRRAVGDEGSAAREGWTALPLAAGFRLGGIGLLVDAAAGTDRLIRFGV